MRADSTNKPQPKPGDRKRGLPAPKRPKPKGGTKTKKT